MAINFSDGTQSGPTKVLQVNQTLYKGTTTQSWSTNGDSGQLSSVFDVSLTPFSRSNLFLIEGCWAISGINQMNVGFSALENSDGGTRRRIFDVNSNVIQNNGTTAWPSSNNWPQIMFAYGPGAWSGNSEINDTMNFKFLTRLNSTSGSGAVTWSFNYYGGETSPVYFNYSATNSTSNYWSMPATSTTTVTEIQA